MSFGEGWEQVKRNFEREECEFVEEIETARRSVLRTATAPNSTQEGGGQTGRMIPAGGCILTWQLNPLTEIAIRQLAYQKWREAGSPEGDDVTFWLTAEKEFLKGRRA